MSEDEQPYEVGYGKPPKSGQFVKGRSGNPKGRPKGSKNLASIVQRESRQPVRVNGPRGPRTVTKAELTVMQMGNKSAQGDARASRDFLQLLRWSEESLSSQTGPTTSHEADQEVVKDLYRRWKRSADDAASINPQPNQEESK
jgi:hypothetical protein